MQTLVITLVGEERPGIVDQVSRHVLAHNGNWLGSSLSKMAGQFAGIIQVSLPQEQIEPLTRALNQIDKLQITVTLGEHQQQTSDSETLSVELVGNDKAGIIQDITSAIHQAGASIIKMHTSCDSAPNWGGELFKAQLQVSLARDSDIDEIQQRLESIANDLVVDLQLS